MTSGTWTHVAACLIVPIAWGAAVHVIFQRFGSRRAGRPPVAAEETRRDLPGSGALARKPDSDDDPAPEDLI